ncbi:MAG: hypothetical protein VX512_12205 [Pseudomonadota bacterium]|nr:hypothetical protein [Pseudomonadota bacterium]
MSAIKPFVFALAAGLAMTGCISTGVKSGAALQSIEEPSLVPDESALDELWLALPEEMKQNTLYGLSVVVFDNYKIVDVETFGAKSALSGEAVTEDTVFSTASILRS